MGGQAGKHDHPRPYGLSCGHEVTYQSMPELGDEVLCVRCEYATVTVVSGTGVSRSERNRRYREQVRERMAAG